MPIRINFKPPDSHRDDIIIRVLHLTYKEQ